MSQLPRSIPYSNPQPSNPPTPQSPAQAVCSRPRYVRVQGHSPGTILGALQLEWGLAVATRIAPQSTWPAAHPPERHNRSRRRPSAAVWPPPPPLPLMPRATIELMNPKTERWKMAPATVESGLFAVLHRMGPIGGRGALEP
ncbi:unnamed protein product [Diplocarpon coronariae]